MAASLRENYEETTKLKKTREVTLGQGQDKSPGGDICSTSVFVLCSVCVRTSFPPLPPRGHTPVWQFELGSAQVQCHAHHSPKLSAQ